MPRTTAKADDKVRPLTRKQQAFVKQLVDNPKQSATEAASQVYAVANRHTAQTLAAENLSKPVIQQELAKYSSKVEDTLYNTVVEWGQHDKPRQREIAQQAAMYIHDKVHGKATQQIEQTTKSVSININLSGDAQ